MVNPEPTENFTSGLSESRPSRIHFPADAMNPSQSGHASGVAQKVSPLVSSSTIRHNSPFRQNRNGPLMSGSRRVRSVDAADMSSGTPRPHRTFVDTFVTPSHRPSTEARAQDDNPGFGNFSDEYDLCVSFVALFQ